LNPVIFVTNPKITKKNCFFGKKFENNRNKYKNTGFGRTPRNDRLFSGGFEKIRVR